EPRRLVALHPTKHGIVERLRVPAAHELRQLGKGVRAEHGDERANDEEHSDRRSERLRVLIRRAQSAEQDVPKETGSSSIFMAAFGGNGHQEFMLVEGNLGR